MSARRTTSEGYARAWTPDAPARASGPEQGRGTLPPMDTTTPPPPTGPAVSTVDRQVPPVRSCTRCDGEQHLLDASGDFGKYRCISCGMVVGFDLESDPAEFLIDRGAPGRYTQGLFGSRLLRPELRLP